MFREKAARALTKTTRTGTVLTESERKTMKAEKATMFRLEGGLALAVEAEGGAFAFARSAYVSASADDFDTINVVFATGEDMPAAITALMRRAVVRCDVAALTFIADDMAGIAREVVGVDVDVIAAVGVVKVPELPGSNGTVDGYTPPARFERPDWIPAYLAIPPEAVARGALARPEDVATSRANALPSYIGRPEAAGSGAAPFLARPEDAEPAAMQGMPSVGRESLPDDVKSALDAQQRAVRVSIETGRPLAEILREQGVITDVPVPASAAVASEPTPATKAKTKATKTKAKGKRA